MIFEEVHVTIGVIDDPADFDPENGYAFDAPISIMNPTHMSIVTGAGTTRISLRESLSNVVKIFIHGEPVTIEEQRILDYDPYQVGDPHDTASAPVSGETSSDEETEEDECDEDGNPIAKDFDLNG